MTRLTAAETAWQLGVSQRTLQRWVETGAFLPDRVEELTGAQYWDSERVEQKRIGGERNQTEFVVTRTPQVPVSIPPEVLARNNRGGRP